MRARRGRAAVLGSTLCVLMLWTVACGTGATTVETSAPPSTAGPTNGPSTTTATVAPPDDRPVYLDPSAPVEARVEDLLARMTLAEKIGQMTLVEKNAVARSDLARLGIGALLSGGGGSPTENTPTAWADMVDGFQQDALASRLGIPILYGADGVHGHSNVRGATIFPHNVGLGAADDPALVEQVGRITALEMAATGVYWNYAPAVSVPQDIRWGRTYEGFSEDTGRVTELAAAYIRGLQGASLAAVDTVIATPKHYVGDGGTVWGTSETADYWIDQGVSAISEEELRAVHLPPYERAIAEGARTVMVSYSSWGGMKMHAQRDLITDVLNGELGFDGLVVSDWGAIDQISDDPYEAIVTAIGAGIDMNMVPRDYRTFIEVLTAAVQAGDVPMSRIDDAVRRILRVKFEAGVFEHPFAHRPLLPDVGSAEHREVAREAVARSLVLLRDEASLLPLGDETALLVGGRAADDIGLQSGGWTITWQGAFGPTTEGTTILDGIEAAAADRAIPVVYEANGRFDEASLDGDVVCIAVVGEYPYAEGVGDDGDLQLPRPDLELLDRMEAACPRLLVVLVAGRPLIVTDRIDRWDAFVVAWLPGSEGAGVADVLFGDRPFTGTLPYTWPRSVDQLGPGRADKADPLFPYGAGSVGP